MLALYHLSGGGGFPPSDDMIVQSAEDLIKQRANPSPEQQARMAPYEAAQTQRLQEELDRKNRFQYHQQQLMDALQRFLRRTLTILFLAILGSIFADIINIWAITEWIARCFLVVAGYYLCHDTAVVVRAAAVS